MSNILTADELTALRNDLVDLFGTSGDTAKTEGTVTRESTLSEVVNPDNTVTADPAPTTIYSGPARVSPIVFRRDRQELAGGQIQRPRQYRLKIPSPLVSMQIGDIWTTTICSDPLLVGKRMEVTDVLPQSESAVRVATLTDTGLPNDPNC